MQLHQKRCNWLLKLASTQSNNSDNKSVIRKSGLDIITNACENESNNTTKNRLKELLDRIK